MPTKKALKLLKAMRLKKTGWHGYDLRILYDGFGFLIRNTSGSHRIVSHPVYKHLRDSFPEHSGELPKSYIEDAVRLIEQLLELLESQED